MSCSTKWFWMNSSQVAIKFLSARIQCKVIFHFFQLKLPPSGSTLNPMRVLCTGICHPKVDCLVSKKSFILDLLSIRMSRLRDQRSDVFSISQTILSDARRHTTSTHILDSPTLVQEARRVRNKEDPNRKNHHGYERGEQF